MNFNTFLTFCLILLLLFLLYKDSNAEVISWKPKNEVTIEKCIEESKQDKLICEKIVKMWQESKKYDTLEIYNGLLQKD